ncbi:hypothetical protein B4U79_06886 [Dinothrombium tinctorium]|uniref:Uncharacterized protein n=1 Tax=Dinothrombium tinctorium TaxID=1965070 RepID=A0A443R1I7_9ACAR|nr:hypothetical protein B4U79_06886 [Dinothrombium tinctorium]
MAPKYLVLLFSIATFCSLCLAATSNVNSNGGSRQSGLSAATGTGILSTIGSLIPGGLGSVVPLVLLFGLGALMVPALGLGLLLREGRRSDYPYYYRSFPSFNINTSAIMDGLSDVFERVMRALDNVEKKYN